MGSFVVRKCKTLDELITEYVALYGKENWALSTYEGNIFMKRKYQMNYMKSLGLLQMRKFIGSCQNIYGSFLLMM